MCEKNARYQIIRLRLGYIPPHPQLQCWLVLECCGACKKNARLCFQRLKDECKGNIEVGGAGDLLSKECLMAASVFFAQPGVKVGFVANVTRVGLIDDLSFLQNRGVHCPYAAALGLLRAALSRLLAV